MNGFVPFAKGKNPPHQRGGTLHRVTVASQQSSKFKGEYRHEKRSICGQILTACHA